jgi:hypothetical protein
VKIDLEKIAAHKNNVCVTISLKTHRTHPENVQDGIELKNLCKEAVTRLEAEFDKRSIQPLLDKLEQIPNEIDVNYLLDSLHIFISNDFQEIVKLPISIGENAVNISQQFNVRTLVKALNRSETYMILLLSQSGVHLYQAMNDAVIQEIRNDDFPFKASQYYHTGGNKTSDPNMMDNMVREYFNQVDKAVVRVHHAYHLRCVVVATEDNFSRLSQVADLLSVYYGYVPVNYNDVTEKKIAADSWQLVSADLHGIRMKKIEEVKSAVSHGKVITEINDIYRAIMEGRGDVLVVNEHFKQAVILGQNHTLELVNDDKLLGVVDDVTGMLAWEVISKKGEVVYTSSDQLQPLGEIALKVRY